MLSSVIVSDSTRFKPRTLGFISVMKKSFPKPHSFTISCFETGGVRKSGKKTKLIPEVL